MCILEKEGGEPCVYVDKHMLASYPGPSHKAGRGPGTHCVRMRNVFRFSLRKSIVHVPYSCGTYPAPPTKRLGPACTWYEAKHHSSLVPRPLTHSSFVVGA